MTNNKRFEDIENSIKALARYVKEEVERLDKKTDTIEKSGHSKHHTSGKSENEAEIHKLSKEIDYLNNKINKILEIPENTAIAMEKMMKEAAKEINEVQKLKDTMIFKEDFEKLEDELKQHKKILQQLKTADKHIEEEHEEDMGNIKRAEKIIGKIDESWDHMDALIQKKIDTHIQKIVENVVRKSDLEEFESVIKTLQQEMSNVDNKIMKATSFEGDVQVAKKKEMEDIKDLQSSMLLEVKALKETIKSIDEESAERISLGMKVNAIEKKLNEITHHLLGSETDKYDAIKDIAMTVRNTEKDIDQKVAHVVMKYIEGFSRELDHKLPKIATEEEFKRFEHEINNKVRNIEAPDITFLEQRMNNVEQKLDKISSLIQNLSKHMPVVIE